MRLDPAKICRDFGDRLARIGLIEVAVDVIEEMQVADSKRCGRATQFGLADGTERSPAQGCPARRPASRARRASPLRDTSRPLQQHTLPACRRLPEQFIVGVGQNTH